LLERSKALSRSEVADLLTIRPKRDPKLFLMEPYDPGKEPLIMIHGLLDSPLAWSALTNELRADPEIRRRYQIWHYLYNTSAPALYSGRILRAQYREMRGEFDPRLNDRASQRTTLLAHSMGGIVARGLITDPGNAFWEAGFTRPLSSLELSPGDRESLVEAFLWKPERSVKRVIFIATPHRGSDYADNPVGRLGQRLVKPPNQFRAFYERVSSANPGAFTEAYADLGEGRLDSVGALSPQQPTLQILADLPLGYPVSLHSMIGNRGKDGPVKESSDGIVPYWSSHLSEAKTEKIIPAGHSMLSEKEVIEETKRLLLLR
jgi:pimeloyl-ACP methyl ester carboxylesterase